jgi:CcmD family protein
VRPLLFLQATPAPTGTALAADDRSTSFRAVEGGGQMQSGERLLVIAYMAIWLLIMFLVVLSFRKQSRLDQRIVSLESALSRARAKDAADAPKPEKGAE